MLDLAAEAHVWAVVTALYTTILVLQLVIPQAYTDGYVWDPVANRPLQYRNNGLKVHVVVCVLAAVLVQQGVVPGDFMYVNFWAVVRAAGGLAFLVSALLFAGGRAALAREAKGGVARNALVDRNPEAPTASRPDVPSDPAEFNSRGALSQFYFGIIFNPRPRLLCEVDVKMLAYLVGATALQLVILSATYHHYEEAMAERAERPVSLALSLYVALFSFFLHEYLYYEAVHAYTYDLFRWRMGFQLTWGCFCFYPYFYPVGVSGARRRCCAKGCVAPARVWCASDKVRAWGDCNCSWGGHCLECRMCLLNSGTAVAGILAPANNESHDATHAPLCHAAGVVSG
jgi:hypothetical protein